MYIYIIYEVYILYKREINIVLYYYIFPPIYSSISVVFKYSLQVKRKEIEVKH